MSMTMTTKVQMSSQFIKMVRRHKKTVNCSTQTDFVPIVALERLNVQTLRKSETTGEYTDYNITIRNPSLMNVPPKPAISKPPKNYTTFVKPITNNEKANSTLADLDVSISDVPTKKVRFLKPGPMTYKKRIMESISNMRIPVAMSEIQTEPSAPEELNLDLDTIMEQAEVTQFMEDIDNEDLLVETEMETVAIGDELRSDVDNTNTRASEDSSVSGNVVSPNQRESALNPSLRRSNEQNDSTNNKQSKNEKPKNQERSFKLDGGKTILIRANFVNIYNHFYDST